LQETRTQLLLDIENWAENLNSKRVYWLNGKAGYGKTTISQTFVQRAFASGLLGASFFCSRNQVDRSNLQPIFPTLAFQLAYQFPDFRKHLVHIMRSDPDIGHDSLSNQLKRLIIEPLKHANPHAVIIIDALDECKDENPASAILMLLSEHIDDFPTVKFFVTGRPERPIRDGFRLPLLCPHTEVLLLHDLEETSVDEDIRIFLTDGLPKLAAVSGINTNPEPLWPAEQDIAALVKKCNGLFIYAYTALKFVSSQYENPKEMLQVIINAPENTRNEAQIGVDPLYEQILQESYSNVPKS
jgi:hypothetical protein